MDLGNYSIDQLKTLHNADLSEARKRTESARSIRTEIERRQPTYHGRSAGNLADAERSLYTARTFAHTPFDLPESENRFREN